MQGWGPEGVQILRTTDSGASQIWLLNGPSVVVLSGITAASPAITAQQDQPALGGAQFGFDDVSSTQLFPAAQARIVAGACQ